MITNLVFKRVNTSINPSRTELKIVEVDIPEIEAGEGWVLSTSGESITFTQLPKPSISEVKPVKEQVKVEPKTEIKQIREGDSFTSDIPGTARLVRRDDRIRITYRRGKNAVTRDKTDRNSVCIDDVTKLQFFNSVKRAHGTNTKDWSLHINDPEYAEWNNFIDKEYSGQRQAINRKLYLEQTQATDAKIEVNSIDNT